MSGSDDLDEIEAPQLSAETFKALQEFYDDQERREQELQALQALSSSDVKQFEENWQLSQFWYSEETASKLAAECFRQAGTSGSIACISSPSVYVKIKQTFPEAKVTLFEYDKRFAAYGDDFVFYDYKSPLQFSKLNGESVQTHFDVVLADPPYLSDECLAKTAITIRYLAVGKIILCTGATMEDLVGRLLSLKTCTFLPLHNKNLANEFRCYANYELDETIDKVAQLPS